MNNLRIRKTKGAQVVETTPGTWRLEIPPGKAGSYRWAQLDDYLHLPRSRFAWQPPFTLEVKARVSSRQVPGTWGFGLWNDPFNASIGIGGVGHRLPALPECAWFFFASPENYLALHDDHPARGFVGATFSSPLIPPILLSPGLPFIPLAAYRPAARLLRKTLRHLIKESAVSLQVDVTTWHTYRMDWKTGEVGFAVDDINILTTAISPHGKMGLVLWLDNQFAAFPPDGQIKFGSLPNPDPVWLELSTISAHEYIEDQPNQE